MRVLAFGPVQSSRTEPAGDWTRDGAYLFFWHWAKLLQVHLLAVQGLGRFFAGWRWDWLAKYLDPIEGFIAGCELCGGESSSHQDDAFENEKEKKNCWMAEHFEDIATR